MEWLFCLIASRLGGRALPTLSLPSQDAHHCSCPLALGLPVSEGHLPTPSKEHVGSSAALPSPRSPCCLEVSEEGWSGSHNPCSLAMFSRLQPFLAATVYRLGFSGLAK